MDDGHIHLLLPAQLPGGHGGVVALHHSAYFVHGFLDGPALADEDTGLTVPGVGTGTGDNQVAYAGESRQGLPSGTHGDSQAGHFRQSPGHEHGLGVVSVAQACDHTGTQGNDVFQSAAQLGTDGIGTGVDPKALGHEGILDKFGKAPVIAGGQAPGGHLPGHFLRMAGAGEGHHLVAGFLGHDLAHAQQTSFLNALGDGDHDGIRLNVGGYSPGYGTGMGGGRGDDHHPAAPDAGRVGGDTKRLGKEHILQSGVLACGLDFRGSVGASAPKHGVVTVFAQERSQGGAPGTGSNNGGFHFSSPLLLKNSVLVSWPFASRFRLERWRKTVSSIIKRAMARTKGWPG